jgi:uncharacterized protein
MPGKIRIEVIQAWPRRYEAACVNLAEGATVSEAIAAAGLSQGDHVGVAVHGETAAGDQPLREGDRVELLRALTIDPKEARRRRASK